MLQAFANSKLQAFINSGLQARNILSGFIIMLFIDESTPYNTEATYDSHKATFEGKLGQVSPEEYGVIHVEMTIGGYLNIKPSSRSYPAVVSVQQSIRPPTNLQIENYFNAIKNNKNIETVYITVDNSGSLTTGDLEPAYSHLVNDYIPDNYPELIIVERTFSHEEWLFEMSTIIDLEVP